MIEIKNLSKFYTMGTNRFKALDAIDLSISTNEYVAIMGASGSGKSTLMNILGCLSQSDEGDYLINGNSVSQLSDDALAQLRNEQIGFVFQSFHLQARCNTLENVLIPTRFNRDQSLSALKGLRERAEHLLERVGLSERIYHKPSELSGGQRQRVAIARALINNPSLLLADEPTGNLDSKTTDEIMSLFQELHQAGQTIILVTHEKEIGMKAQKIVRLSDGKIVNINQNTTNQRVA